jgi:hypothetical protein
MSQLHALPTVGDCCSCRTTYPALVVGKIPKDFSSTVTQLVIPSFFVGLFSSPLALCMAWYFAPKQSKPGAVLALQVFSSFMVGALVRLMLAYWRTGVNGFLAPAIDQDNQALVDYKQRMEEVDTSATITNIVYAGLFTALWAFPMRYFAKKATGKHFVGTRKIKQKAPPFGDTIPKTLRKKKED